MNRKILAAPAMLAMLETLIALLAGGCSENQSKPQPRPDLPPAGAVYLETIAGDLREVAQLFAAGRLSGAQYSALVVDRTGKARRYHQDAVWREEADRGDRDRDGVPDRFDACDTPHLQPTDEKGCPLPAPPCREGDPRCSGPSTADDRRTRALLDRATLMFNPACDSSPAPQQPVPIEWGRGQQTAAGTAGFNLAVTKVTNQRPGCEFFYEMEFRIKVTPPSAAPTVRHLTVLFRNTENLMQADKLRAVFGIAAGGPASPARTALRDAFGHFAGVVQWRVRAVNGAQKSSAWSDLRAQGPASGGVAG